MFKKILVLLKTIFTAPKLDDIKIDWTIGDVVRYFSNQTEEKAMRVAEAQFKLQKDATQKQLTIQHRTMVIALIGVLISSAVAIAAILVAVTSHQNVVIKVVQLKQ